LEDFFAIVRYRFGPGRVSPGGSFDGLIGLGGKSFRGWCPNQTLATAA
jgi:hypothetical protein